MLYSGHMPYSGQSRRIFLIGSLPGRLFAIGAEKHVKNDMRGTFFERKEVYYYHDLPTITAHDCSRKDKSERAP